MRKTKVLNLLTMSSLNSPTDGIGLGVSKRQCCFPYTRTYDKISSSDIKNYMTEEF